MLGLQAGGRHALDEDAVQTPIFHALARGGRTRRQQEGATASLEEFRRDPPTAPIPLQALAPAPVPARHAPSRRERQGTPADYTQQAGRRERSASPPRDWPGLT